ncbi:histone H1-like [Punica granatum]|uniref:Histone H1-like n=1 Tax=Punica granatum TaxID=22663 RepID=A0A6P8E1R6_PUNGR|nr:histone H1-like [Punica granatum]
MARANRAVAHHPPYSELISEAILTLKDRRGSSQQAIAKFIEDKYGAALPSNFRKILSVQLRKLVKSEKLSKIKNSYKVSSGPQRPTPLVTKLKGKRAMKKKEKSKTKIKRLSQVQTPEALKGAEKGMPEKGQNRKLKRLSQIRTPEDLRKTNKKRNLIAGKGKDVTLKN